MAITILERPQSGFVTDCFSATIDEDYTGKATVNTLVPHNKNDGDYIYITSNIENYNGFFVVSYIDGYHFFILPYPGADPVAYIVDADITYCIQEDSHGWSCVHLPIVYRLRSDIFPVDPPGASVSSFENDHGYTKITLSIGFIAQEELEFFVIDGAASEEVNGVFQIITKYSGSVYTINLAYDASYSFTGGNLRLYYNNYAVLVRVYAGIRGAHFWESIKPYELAATLKFIPDENNECKFSINEILKSYITHANNTLLATLPNNTDFWCNFYIETAESFDQSDGYTITTQETAFTSDEGNFEGYAAHAQLPFKNQYSGFLSDYVIKTSSHKAKWLTAFVQPVYFTGKYMDLSVIYGRSNQIRLFKDGVQILASTYDEGVYRFPITAAGVYKVQVLSNDMTEEITVVEDTTCSSQDIYLTWLIPGLPAFDYWNFQAQKDYIQDIQETGETKVNLLPDWPNSYGSFADSIRKQTFRKSNQSIVVRSQYVTEEQLEAIKNIRLSTLVQIMVSRSDRRTVIVDSDSFTTHSDGDKLFQIEFTISYTNDNPTQTA